MHLDPPSLEDPSTYSLHLGILVVGIVGVSSGSLSSEIVNLAMKSARAYPLIAGHGLNSISNCLSSIAHFRSRIKASNFWKIYLRGVCEYMDGTGVKIRSQFLRGDDQG